MTNAHAMDGLGKAHETARGAARDATNPETYRDTIYRIALSILASRDLAEDATQDTILRLNRDPRKLKEAECPVAWVRTVTVRTAITLLGKSRRFVALRDDLEGPTFDGQGIAVAQTLRTLKPEHRVILALAHGEGMSQREIAEALEIPEGTVASRLHAARAAFRAAWEDER